MFMTLWPTPLRYTPRPSLYTIAGLERPSALLFMRLFVRGLELPCRGQRGWKKVLRFLYFEDDEGVEKA